MASNFDSSFAESAAPEMFRYFGERSADGEWDPVEVWAPGAATSESLTAIIGSLSDDDELQFAETTTVHDERRQSCRIIVSATAVVSPEATIEVPKYAGERFTIDSIAVAGSMQTIQLSRYVIERIQRRGLVRGE